MSSNVEFAEFSIGRATSGVVQEVLSVRNDKRVELVRDTDGEFVRRTYQRGAVREIEQSGISFGECWQVFNQMVQTAGIDLVPSKLVEDSNGSDPIIVTQYLGNIDTVDAARSLPRESKVKLARGLGGLLTAHNQYLPDPQGWHSDAFAVSPETSEALLIDVDPYLKARRSRSLVWQSVSERIMCLFMDGCKDSIVEWANSEAERTSMAIAFCQTAGKVLTDEIGTEMLMSFSNIHLMSNGLDPRTLNLRSR